ncbi:hypothetical protein PWT90_06502 [Aphanocladium album]|nr:hypothetical protein PWT90_06502 [Aphanocladium album]
MRILSIPSQAAVQSLDAMSKLMSTSYSGSNQPTTAVSIESLTVIHVLSSTYVACINPFQIRQAQICRRAGQLAPEQRNRPLDALPAKDVGVHERPPQADGPHTERQQLERVHAVPHPAVDLGLELAEYGRIRPVDLERDLERRRGAVELPAAVIGEDDGGDLVLNGEVGVVDGRDAF